MSQSRQLTVPFPSSDTYRDRERERRGMGTLRLTFFLQLSDYGVLSSVHGPRKADIQAMITCFFKHNHRVMTAHCVLSITWHYPSLGYLPKASLYTKPVLPCKMGQGAAEKEISYKKKHLINKPCSSFPCYCDTEALLISIYFPDEWNKHLTLAVPLTCVMGWIGKLALENKGALSNTGHYPPISDIYNFLWQVPAFIQMICREIDRKVIVEMMMIMAWLQDESRLVW